MNLQVKISFREIKLNEITTCIPIRQLYLTNAENGCKSQVFSIHSHMSIDSV